MDDRHLNDPLDLNRHFANDLDNFLDDNLYLLDDLLPDKFFPYNLDLSELNFLHNNLNYLLNDLRDLNYPFNSPVDWNYSLNYPINRFVDGLDVVDNLQSLPVLDDGDCLLDYPLDDLNCRYLDYPLDDLLPDHCHLNNSLHYGLDGDDLLSDYLDLFGYLLDVVEDSLDLDYFLDLDDLLDERRDLDDLDDLLRDVDDPLDDGRDLNDFLDDLLHLDYFLNNLGLDGRDLQRDVNELLYLDYLIDLDYLLNFLDDWDHDGHLDPPLHYLLHDPLNLDDLGHRSEHFQYVIHVHHAHDLGRYHPQDSFVHLQSHPRLCFHLLHLLQQGLDQDPQVELNLSRLLTAIRIHVLYSHHLGDIFDDVDQLIHLIHLNHLDYLLLEILTQLFVHLF